MTGDLLANQYAFRAKLVELLERDLIGPGEPDERIDDPPILRYSSGILYPRSEESVAPEQVHTDDDGDEATAPEPTVASANARYPSSMAITFTVDEACPSIEITIDVARYEREDTTENEEESTSAWRRRPLAIEPVTVDMQEGVLRPDVAEGLELFCRVRAVTDGRRSVTVALANTFTGTGVERDPISFFQPRLEVTSVGEAPFLERAFEQPGTSDQDLRSYRLLYRSARVFAAGHGCAAEWDSTDTGDRATAVRTTFLPTHSVPIAESNPDIALEALGFKHLAEAPREAVLGGLRDLCDRYEAWISERQGDAKALDDPELKATADDHLADCSTACARMRRGVDVIEEDELAWVAFRLMNEAMLEQRARTDWLAAGAPGDSPNDEADDSSWRAFQLAFILLCLPGITGDEDERRLADLLWFPTGGGKTEAYLGLIAFTLFLRRLRAEGDSDGGGVAVIMRYTLRLLTLQQFERAALLICACERIRRREPALGDDEIQIGLWVGRAATPNTLQEAEESLARLRRDEELTEANPVQIRSCPWCGTGLRHRNYFVGERRRQLIIACSNKSCEFEKRLPVLVVDEDVYSRRPSLIIATADKFAQLPWNDDCRELFNLSQADPPPELIIQDELHLISGPLGTLAGLYETAVDMLCTRKGLRPKVIASTATIRRAKEQGRALFGREMRQFPPPALDQGNSWFSVEAPEEKRGARLYVGSMAPGKSHATLLIRAYAALLQGAYTVDAEPEVKDPYWTLVGYFNSLRVLGGARIQVQDDVRDRIAQLAAEGQARSVEEIVELTSRQSSGEIPRSLEQMARDMTSDDAIDVLLATNMISVGVDIDRLGLMVVMGQPQATAEYIQATSRVGRRHPGLILTLFNSARSRDRSHYESFTPYHAALYRQVESSSVTPFSPRARDRALHAVMVSIARLTEPGFAGNAGAAAAADHRDRLEHVRDLILERVAEVDPDELEETRSELHDLIDFWVWRAERRPDLLYNQPWEPDRALLAQADGIDPAGEVIATLNSLRDVDQESDIYLVS